MPKANAVLDCSRIISVGHCIPQSYQPISANQLMDEFPAGDETISNQPEKAPVRSNFICDMWGFYISYLVHCI
jgi:hypothetical protein